jgi:uncharacterized protein (TIGR03663 family)
LFPFTEKFTPSPSPKIRWVIFIAIALLALVVRLPHLGERPMHTDESVNAYIIGGLLAGEKYRYDPQDRHGPALYLLAKPVVQLCGAKNFSELTESQLRLSTVLVGTLTVLMFGAGVEMFGFIPCLVAALLFAFAPLPVYYNRYFIHETLFVAATLGLILCVGRLPGWWGSSRCDEPTGRSANRSAWFTAALAGFCAALMLAGKETAVIHFFAIAVALVAIRFGTPASGPARANHAGFKTGVASAKIIFAATFIFLVAAILLFTWGGQNWPALADLFRAIPHFAARAGGQGHEQPFWYYAHLLAGGWSGTAILVVAAIGLVHAIRSPSAGPRFTIAVYALLIAAIYSVIPYKTPWLALNFWLPIAILAGLAVEWFWLEWPRFFIRVLLLIFIAVIGCLIAHDTRERVFKNPAGEINPYAYAHTGEDLLRLPARLANLARQNKISNPRIAVVAADAWPLPWYLRKFSQVGFWQPDQETGPADFFITTTDVSDKLAVQLKNFRPEYFGVRPNVLLILWSPATTNTAIGPAPSPRAPP